MSEKLKWDVKRGNSVYSQVDTEVLKEWIKKGIVKEDDVEVQRSGTSAWHRPEDLDEFKKIL